MSSSGPLPLFQLVVLKRRVDVPDTSATSDMLDAGRGVRFGVRLTDVCALTLPASEATAAIEEPSTNVRVRNKMLFMADSPAMHAGRDVITPGRCSGRTRLATYLQTSF